MTALILSSRFNLTQTYFLLAGIAGVNPRHATIGSVALARYTVQVALQYEIDPRSLPDDWPTGYILTDENTPLNTRASRTALKSLNSMPTFAMSLTALLNAPHS